MLTEHFDLIESIGFDLLIAGLFFFIGMAIRDVLHQADVPPFGKRIVWGVLTVGCASFIIKGLIQLYWQTTGLV